MVLESSERCIEAMTESQPMIIYAIGASILRVKPRLTTKALCDLAA